MLLPFDRDNLACMFDGSLILAIDIIIVAKMSLSTLYSLENND